MKKPAKKCDISQKIELPGVRPATLKLVGRAEDSFFLYRSSRKLGTARIEPDGDWTARIEEDGSRLVATAKSASELLKLAGTYLLAQEAREAAAKPVEESNPDLRINGKKSPEEKLSIEFARRAQATRIAELDALIKELRKRIKKG